jgi:hypothetical protein
MNSGLRAVAGALKSVASEIITVRTGTVVSDYAPMSQTNVILDNDPDGATVQAMALNQPLAMNTRVSMLAYPPRGLVIVGTMSQLPETVDSGWQYVGDPGSAAFLNGWGNFGGGWTPARYRKIGGRVFLEGLVSAGTAASPILTLPAAYRPTVGAVMFAAVTFRRVTNANTGTGTVFTNGSNQADVGAASAGTAHTHPGAHQHQGTWEMLSTTTRMDVSTLGNVTQSGGTDNTFVGLWGSFFTD